MGSTPKSGVDEFAAMAVAALGPAVLALVLVDTKILVTDRRRGEAGHDDGDVAGLRDHRVGAIGFALESSARMRMDVRNDGELARAADRPELGESAGAENAHTARVGRRIEIVIEDDIDGGAAAAMIVTQQERAGFVPALRAPVQLSHGSRPQRCGAVQTVLRRRECPNNRLD